MKKISVFICLVMLISLFSTNTFADELSIAKSEAPQLLVAANDAAPKSASELVGITWSFGRTDGTVLSTTMKLAADGRIVDGTGHWNESYWKYEKGILYIIGGDGTSITTTFDRFSKVNGKLTMTGAYAYDANITHVMRQLTESESDDEKSNITAKQFLPNTEVGGSLVGSAYVWYKIPVKADGNLSVTLDTTAGNVELRIFSPDMVSLTNADNWGKEITLTVDGLLPGDYYVKLLMYGFPDQDYCDYTLKNTFDEALLANDVENNDKSDGASVLPLSGEVTGHVGYDYGYGNSFADLSDWWRLEVPQDGNLSVFLQQTNPGNFQLAVFKKDAVTEVVRPVDSWGKTIAFEIKDIKAGTYFVKISRYAWDFTPYMLSTVFSGSGIVPDQKNISETFESGNRLSWTPYTNAIGYRIFRSTTKGVEGISVTDFYITSVSYADVNVESNTTYHYTIRPVLAEADPVRGIDEKLGPVIATYTLKTGNVTYKPGTTKNFIMLQLDNPYLTKNGIKSEIDPGRGTKPVIISSRTMVPIRAIVEAMGGTVGWDPNTQKITLKARGNTVEMWIGKTDIFINGVGTKMDVTPVVTNDRTFVPVRFAAENLNCKVDWINSTKEAVIVYEE